MTEVPPAPSHRELLEQYVTREARIARIREIERSLSKMELEDESNDPVIIEAHIRLTRGVRMGCGVFLLCLGAMCLSVVMDPEGRHAWVKPLMGIFAVGGTVMVLRGLLYRPDPKLIEADYAPHRRTSGYRRLVDELEILARALAQDLRPEDEE